MGLRAIELKDVKDRFKDLAIETKGDFATFLEVPSLLLQLSPMMHRIFSAFFGFVLDPDRTIDRWQTSPIAYLDINPCDFLGDEMPEVADVLRNQVLLLSIFFRCTMTGETGHDSNVCI
jgi:hypothetical protein